MKTVLFVAYYELKDYMICIKESFEKYYFDVISYPLFQYAYDSNDKIENYVDHMNDFIQEKEPDIILWWFIDVPIDIFKKIRRHNPKCLMIMYNADDPTNMSKELFDKAKSFDIIVTPCKGSNYMYSMYSGVKEIIHGPMGFDPELFCPIKNVEDLGVESLALQCDISMVVYNLCLDKDYYPNQVIHKKELIEIVIKYCTERNLIFKLYGIPTLKELFPLHYCGELPYYKYPMLYNFSKVNIVSSSDYTKHLYINEQVFSILGSGGLLMMDKVHGIEKILTDSKNCIIYNRKNFIDKLDNIFFPKKNNNFDIAEIKENARIISLNYTWEKWVEAIVREIGKKYFNGKVYVELYDLPMTDNLLEYWMDQGILDKQICFDFNVPEIFDDEAYCSKFGIKNHKQYAFLHWKKNSQNEIFMKKKAHRSISSFNPPDYNITAEDYFNISSILNKISKYNTRNEGLKELGAYCDGTPYIKINEIIDQYFKLV